MSLSPALHDQIPLMELVKELGLCNIEFQFHPLKVHCKAFKDNSGALELVWMPKIHPRMKHLNNYYHYFWSHTGNGEITIHAVSMEQQIGDMFTKPLQEALLVKFRTMFMGW